MPRSPIGVRISSCTGGDRRGFTLIELMVVIVILGLLMGIVVPNAMKPLHDATHDTALNQLHSIGGAIEYYVLRTKNLPPTLDELTRPGGASDEAFLKKIPLDPWASPYEYRIRDAKRHEYELASAGEDRQMGTEDDIVFPDPDVR